MKDAIRIYAKAGAFLGIVTALFLARALGVVEILGDTLVFILYHVILFLIPMTLAGALLHIVFKLVSRPKPSPGRRKTTTLHRCAASGTVAGLLTTLLIIELTRPFRITLGSSFLLAVIFLSAFLLTAAAILILTARGFLNSGERIRPFKNTAARGCVLIAAVTLLTLIMGWHRDPPRDSDSIPTKSEPRYNVLIIGLDGADWNVIDRMIEEGRLPNLSRLISTGVRADLLSEVSVLNPLANTSSSGIRSSSAWTSISTGKTAMKHGVQDFMASRVWGMSRPVPARIPTWSLARRFVNLLGINLVSRSQITPAYIEAVTMWEVLSHCGYQVGVLGWWLTNTDLPVNGYKVENAFVPGEGAVYPDSLALPLPDSTPDFGRFTSYEYDPDYKKHFRRNDAEYIRQNFMHTLESDFVRDSFMLATARRLAVRWPVDFSAVYFLGPDNVEHLFWKYMEPSLFHNVDDEDKQRFGGVIENYYEYLDGAVGTLEATRSDSTVLIICSDHGMGPWVGNRSRLYRAVMGNVHLRNSGNHRIAGILIMQGGPVKRGAMLEQRRIQDIAPTVLHLMGLPVTRDMDGEVMITAFEDAFQKSRPVRRIPSYQGLKGKTPQMVEEKDDEFEYRERLKALGYIE